MSKYSDPGFVFEFRRPTCCKDYKERMQYEYAELTYRINRLVAVLTDPNPEFEFANSLSLFEAQLKAMRSYQSILEQRAANEGVSVG